MKYIAVGPMKGKSYKINNTLKVVDGVLIVDDLAHKHFGHVLEADYSLLPEYKVLPEVLVEETPADPPNEEPKTEETKDPPADPPHEEPKPNTSGKGRRK